MIYDEIQGLRRATMMSALLIFGAECADPSECVAALIDFGVPDAAERIERLRAVTEAAHEARCEHTNGALLEGRWLM